MSSYNIDLFISHSWKYSDHYDMLCKWIFDENWTFRQIPLNFNNYSVPKDNPIHNAPTDSKLKDAIYDQIACSHIVIIPTGMYANYSEWISKEIEGAKHYNKPILAVNPWGQERGAGIVKYNADKCVGWNSKPVIEGIWSLFRTYYE